MLPIQTYHLWIIPFGGSSPVGLVFDIEEFGRVEPDSGLIRNRFFAKIICQGFAMHSSGIPDLLDISSVGSWRIFKLRTIPDGIDIRDIGLKESGLVHISQLKAGFVSDVNEVVKLHQHVQVKVLEIDESRKRIQLTMIL